jgi:hypothetical protein
MPVVAAVKEADFRHDFLHLSGRSGSGRTILLM